MKYKHNLCYGIVQQIITDKGKAFMSETTTEICRLFKDANRSIPLLGVLGYRTDVLHILLMFCIYYNCSLSTKSISIAKLFEEGVVSEYLWCFKLKYITG